MRRKVKTALMTLGAAGALLALSVGVGMTLFDGAPGTDRAPETGGGFTLRSADGPVSLSDFAGRPVLLFFGYTHCPDICPTTMNHVAAALDALAPERRRRVQVLFVTVDPERDTPARLAEYVAFFGEGFIGLGGARERIERVARRYGVEFFRDEASGEDYLVNHTSRLFLIDGDGRVADVMSHNTPPEAIAAELRRTLAGA